MLAHLFGAMSSPSCMNFGLKQMADDNQEMFSEEAVRTLRRNFYVDDCLKSIKVKPRIYHWYQNFPHYFPKGISVNQMDF